MRLTPHRPFCPARLPVRRIASRREPQTTTARTGEASPQTMPSLGGPGHCARSVTTRPRLRHGVTRRRVVLLLGWLVAAGMLLTSSAARADTVHYVALAATVDQVLNNIRNWIMGILAGVAVVFITIGGLRYLLASGDPGEIEKAKGAFKAAGIGFGLAALAPLVVEILKGIVGGV